MDETIYRQDAIDALWEERMKYSKEMERNLETCSFALRADNKARQNRVDEDIEIIRQLPSAQEWIPCSRELPKKDGQYNVTVKYEHVDGYEDVYSEHGYWVDGHWDADFGHCGKVEKVLAWMPLPKPWKGGQDG